MMPAAPTLTLMRSSPTPGCSSCSVISLYRLQACRTKRPNGGSALMWGAGAPCLSRNWAWFYTPLLSASPSPVSLLPPAGLHLVLLDPFHWGARAMKNQQRSHQLPPPHALSSSPFTRPTAGCRGCPCARVFSGGLKAERRSAWIKCVCVRREGGEGTEGALSGGVLRPWLVL